MATKIQKVMEQLNVLLEPSKRVNKDINFLSYEGHRYLDNITRIRCRDGFEVSVQASHFHYCLPRDSTGPWTHVELGFPTARVPSLREYRDGPPPDTGTVFGYVPIEKVAKVLINHGGIAS